MKIALILPVHNHLDYTKTTLREVAGQLHNTSNASFQIILIDDGSTDGTSEWVAHNFPDVILLKGDGNLWWSGAVNLGARYAFEELKSDYVLLWNNDIATPGNYFQTLLTLIHEYGPNTILGSKIRIRENPDYLWSMGGYFNPVTGSSGMYGYYEKDSEKYNQVKYVDWLTGMGTVISREVIAKTGYWDNVNFPQYHGDSDFTYRAKKAGFIVMVHPDLVMYNAVKNSGIEHGGNFRQLLQLLVSVRSKSSLKKKLKFYRLHATSVRAYLPLAALYFRIIGGFFKSKIQHAMGIKSKKFRAL